MLHWARANLKILKHTLVVWDLFAVHHDDRRASIPLLDYMVSEYEVAVKHLYSSTVGRHVAG